MKTSHEKIIKRADGGRVKITVSMQEVIRGRALYGEVVESCAKGKRTWKSSFDRDDYLFRRMSMAEREAHILVCNRYVASKEEILAAKMELWESLKPTL